MFVVDSRHGRAAWTRHRERTAAQLWQWQTLNFLCKNHRHYNWRLPRNTSNSSSLLQLMSSTTTPSDVRRCHLGFANKPRSVLLDKPRISRRKLPCSKTRPTNSSAIHSIMQIQQTWIALLIQDQDRDSRLTRPILEVHDVWDKLWQTKRLKKAWQACHRVRRPGDK